MYYNITDTLICTINCPFLSTRDHLIPSFHRLSSTQVEDSDLDFSPALVIDLPSANDSSEELDPNNTPAHGAAPSVSPSKTSALQLLNPNSDTKTTPTTTAPDQRSIVSNGSTTKSQVRFVELATGVPHQTVSGSFNPTTPTANTPTCSMHCSIAGTTADVINPVQSRHATVFVNVAGGKPQTLVGQSEGGGASGCGEGSGVGGAAKSTAATYATDTSTISASAVGTIIGEKKKCELCGEVSHTDSMITHVKTCFNTLEHVYLYI